MKTNLKGNRGAALVLTVFAMLFVALLVIAFLHITTTEIQIVDNQRYVLQTLYIAHAGIEDAIYELRQNSSWSTGFVDKVFPLGSSSTYTVTVNNTVVTNGKALITSTASVSTFTRVVEAQVRIYGSSSKVKTIYWKEL